jgi:hypothetical protein
MKILVVDDEEIKRVFLKRPLFHMAKRRLTCWPKNRLMS